jgi:hypothetical protein
MRSAGTVVSGLGDQRRHVEITTEAVIVFGIPRRCAGVSARRR